MDADASRTRPGAQGNLGVLKELDTHPDRDRQVAYSDIPLAEIRRYDASLAERVKAWRRPGSGLYIGVTRLKSSRGWTDRMIGEFLGNADRRAKNPHYRTAAERRLYRMDRVEQAEKDPAFIREMEKIEAARQNRPKTLEECFAAGKVSWGDPRIDDLKRRAGVPARRRRRLHRIIP